MKKFNTTSFGFVVAIQLIGSGTAQAADTTSPTVTASSGTVPLTLPATLKSSTTVKPADRPGIPENPDSSGLGHAGGPNMGSGDHIPGTAGTSGQ